MISLKTKGLKELSAMLTSLPEKMRVKVVRPSLRVGGVVVQEEAQANVRTASGLLRDGIKVTTSLKGGDLVIAKIKTTGEHGHLANWIEYGTAAHEIVAQDGGVLLIAGEGSFYVTRVEHPGAAPYPFMRPALETKAAEVINTVANEMKKRLTKAGISGAGDVDAGVGEEPSEAEE